MVVCRLLLCIRVCVRLCSVVAADHTSSSSGHDHGESSTGLNSASTVTVSAMLMAVLAFVANKAASL